MKWSKIMYQLFALMVLDEIFGSCDSWNPSEAQTIKDQINKFKSQLNPHQIDLVKFRVRKTRNNYKINLLDHFQNIYRKEIENGEEMYPSVEYDQNIYNIWTQAVRRRVSVKIQYESTTSGITTRIVDPYKTNSPYGISFCHTKKEERKFRFDRIIEITLIDSKFIKPKSPKQNQWKTETY